MKYNSRKIFIIVFTIILALLTVFHFFYYEQKITILKHEIYSQKSLEIKNLFKDEVERKFGKTISLTYLLSKNDNLIEALVKNDNSLLDFKEVIANIEKYEKYKNLWIQIIDKDGYSFYRSWSKEVGDHIATDRIDVADIIKNPIPKQSISTGKHDMTFKSMIPLYKDGTFIGMIESITKFNSIAIILKDNKIEPLMVLHENYKKQLTNPFTKIFIGNNYVANLNASKELMKKVEKIGLKKFFYIDNYLIFEDYLVTTEEIKNAHNGEMGFFIFFYKEKDIDQNIINNFKTDYFTKVIVVLLGIVFLILYSINKVYTRELNNEVRQKTLKIKKQQNKLATLLKIYDEHVIFSKTDKKGIITHASKAFCRISGYSRSELIGKPHNILRHPDMSKKSFKNMWETIQQGKVWEGEVKNLKKDGSFYWVSARVEPEYDSENNIKGYVAIRHDITDTKEVEEIQKEIIFTMGSIGENRSKETANHVKRVTLYSELLATKLGLDLKQVELLKHASPMHDIGKIGIPDSILNKPSKLTDEEFVIMKTHANIGYDILKSSDKPILKAAAIVAHEHHEKWDGSGYPRGLKGSQIHIYGRITALADVFDALGSDRVYKKAWDDEKIFEFFRNQKGKHFDPKLIDLFFENLDEFLIIRNNFKDN